MGGIPGSSRGCITCKRRKLKCDFQHPLCSRCRRSGYKCEGYARATVFVNRNDSSMATSDRNVLNAALRENSYQRRRPQKVWSGKLLNDRGAALTFAYSNVAVLPALWQDFMDECGPRWREWDWAIKAQPCYRPLLCNALFAAATGSAGRRRSDEALVLQAMSAYSTALQQMRQSMLSSDPPPNQLLLTVIIAFQAYEMSQCTGSLKSWATHIQGALAIMNSEDPKARNKASNQKIIRVLALYLGLLLPKQASILKPVKPTRKLEASNALSQSASSMEESQLEYQAELVELLDTCQHLEDDFRKFNLGLPECLTIRTQQLLADADDFEGRLVCWSGCLQGANYSDISIPRPQEAADDECFPVRIVFKNRWAAHDQVHYWCTKLRLCELKSKVLYWTSNTSPSEQALAMDEEMEFLASLICKSLHCFRELTNTLLEAPRELLYPLWAVSRHFSKSRGSEWQWCKRFSRLLMADGLQIAECFVDPDPWTTNSAGLASDQVLVS